jgi:hypothetical protein
VTNSSTQVLTGDHCVIHAPLRVAEVRAYGAKTVPDGFEPLGLEALARRLAVSRKTAHRRMQRLSAQQHRPEVLRVVFLPVFIGSGAVRPALHVLWPRAGAAPAP